MKRKSCFQARIHLIGKTFLYASRGNQIFRGDLKGYNWQRIASMPIINKEKFKSFSRLSRRLFRSGISHILSIDRRSLLIVGYDQLCVYDLFKGSWITASQIVGKRPLLIGQSPNVLCYGEYRSNPENSPISVITSNDKGMTWKKSYSFKNIRHIHGVVWDKYWQQFWITTGDNGIDCGLWLADEEFKKVQIFLNDGQQARAVQPIFTKDYIYYATDTHEEQNHIYRICRKTKEREQLIQVQSSVFYGAIVNNRIFFATVCEPKSLESYVAIYGSDIEGKGWREVLRLKKDLWSKRYFQYGQILFPYGENQTPYLWFTPMSCTYDQQVMRMNINDN